MRFLEFFSSSQGLAFIVEVTVGLLLLTGVVAIFADTFKRVPGAVAKYIAERSARGQQSMIKYAWNQRVTAAKKYLCEKSMKPRLIVCVQNQNGNRGLEETRMIALLTEWKCGNVPMVDDETWQRLAAGEVKMDDVDSFRHVILAKVIQGGKDTKIDFRIVGWQLASSTPTILAADVLEGSEEHMQGQVLLALCRVL